MGERKAPMKKRISALLAALLLFTVLWACGDAENGSLPLSEPQQSMSQSFDEGSEDSERDIGPDRAAYTILVYLNGSDLESESSMATGDLLEMMEAAYPRDQINVVLQTGGTAQWQNEVVPNDRLARYLVAEGDLQLLEELEQASVGESATLTSFIDYGMEAFPADRYGLILWNHGGGAVSGFAVDENFGGDGLTLRELHEAFASSGMAAEPFEFIGFDACLMANLETAHIAGGYARYLIASEELEPGYGWHYTPWLNALGENPMMDGAEIGRLITDSFVEFYDENGMAEEATTLSVIDLQWLPAVTEALENFVQAADLSQYEYGSVARPRSQTKEFGLPTEYGGSTDMIDLVHLAEQFADTLPDESTALIDAVSGVISYSRTGSYVSNANGLSVFFPYTEKWKASERMEVYATTGFSETYIAYLADFTEILTGETMAEIDVSAFMPEQNGNAFDIVLTPEQLQNISAIYFTAWQAEGDMLYTQIYEDSYVEISEDGRILTEFDGYVGAIDSHLACMYEVESGKDYTRYAIPATLNGQSVNLMILFDSSHPDGVILGALPTYESSGGMAPKKMLEIKDGDVLMLEYYAEEFAEIGDESTDEAYYEWYDGEEFTVDGELYFAVAEVPAGEYLYGFTLVDFQGNEYYTDFIVVEFE